MVGCLDGSGRVLTEMTGEVSMSSCGDVSHRRSAKCVAFAYQARMQSERGVLGSESEVCGMEEEQGRVGGGGR